MELKPTSYINLALQTHCRFDKVWTLKNVKITYNKEDNSHNEWQDKEDGEDDAWFSDKELEMLLQ